MVTPAGTSAASAADQFTYGPVLAPTVTGLTPNTGSAAAAAFW